jgi:two-component system chemotaxis response regulator CheY
MKKILLAEDSFALREYIKKPLQYANYEVIEAMDGLEALGLYQKYEFDLIITDFEMPHLNGVEWILIARERFEKLCPPVLMFISDKNQKVFSQQKGFLFSIEKPFHLDKFLSKVNFFLQEKHNFST